MSIENISLQLGQKAFGIDSGVNQKTITDNEITQPFDYFFNAYSNILSETNAYQLEADKVQLDYAAGKTDDMLAVMLAQEKAYASLNFTVQVTSKILEAYKEIMRISL